MASLREKEKEASRENTYYLIILANIYFEYVRPASILPFLSIFRLSGIILLVSVLIWLFRCNKAPMGDRLIKLYCIGLVEMVIWVPIAVNNFYAFNATLSLIFYLTASILPLAALVNTDQRLRHFFHHWVIINFLVALVTIHSGGKGTGDFLADENDVGMAMNVAFPYAFYSIFYPDISKRKRLFYIAASAVILFAIIYTRSRGALVGFAAVLFVTWLLSTRKFKNLAIGLLTAVIFGGVILSLLPDGYLDRMQTASDPQNSTRVERIYSWKIGWVMFTKNPIFGVGPGNYPYRVVDYQELVDRPAGRPPIPGRVAHSFYFTLLPELGMMGVIIFVSLSSILVSRMRAIYKSKQALSQPSNKLNAYGLIAKANIVSLAAYLSAGAFITVNYYPCYWLLIGFALILHRQFHLLPKVGSTPRGRAVA